jgi:hypothetical protein
MEKHKLLEFLLTLASSVDEQLFSNLNRLVMEIFYLITEDLNPKEILYDEVIASVVMPRYTFSNVNFQGLMTGKGKENNTLSKSLRHGRFGGGVQVHLKVGLLILLYFAVQPLITQTLCQGGKRISLQKHQALTEPIERLLDSQKHRGRTIKNTDLVKKGFGMTHFGY